MRYLGGKRRLARKICDVILSRANGRSNYVEPFIGGGAVFATVSKHFTTAYGSDLDPTLIAFWSGVRAGWQPPTVTTLERYHELRHAEPSPERGWYGYALSYGGKFFGGFIGAGKAPRSGSSKGIPEEDGARRGLERDRAAFERDGVTLACHSYLDLEPGPDDVVYCDPPYRGTTGYSAVGEFDHEAFWGWAETASDRGALVVVSEYELRPGWRDVAPWGERAGHLNRIGSESTVVERLLVRDHLEESMSAPAPAIPLGNTPAVPKLPGGEQIDEFHDFPRDQWDRPLIARRNEAGEPTPNPLVGQTDRHGTPILWVSDPYQRASGAGSALEYEGGLNSWKLRQAVIGLISRPDLFALAQSVQDPGGAGRSEIDEHIGKAQDAAGTGAAANLGTAGHAFAEKIDRGQKLPPLDEPFASWVRAYVELTQGWRWHHIEARLVCDEVALAGRTDRIGSPPRYMITPDGQIIGPDDIVAVDLKTSSSSRYFGIKFAVQLAVYACGDLYDPRTGKRTPTGARRDWALVVHVPTGGTSGALYWVNVGVGLELAHLAKRVLRERSRKDLVRIVDTTQTYATLDEALAAGGVVLEPRSAVDPIGTMAALEHPEPAPTTSTVPASVTDAIRPDLGPSLQRARELEMVRTAPPRGGLDAVRERLGARWSDELEAAHALRSWQLDVLARLDAAPDLEALHAISAEVQGYNAWTSEMGTAAAQNVARLERGHADD